MPFNLIRSAWDTAKEYASGLLEFAGDLAIVPQPSNYPRVQVREVGISTYYRRVHYTDPDCYYPGNPLGTLNAMKAKVFQNWGAPAGYGRFYGEMILAPGNLGQLSAAFELDFPQNLTIIGHGSGGDEVTGGSGGHAMTTLTGPNGGDAFRIVSTTGGNYSGPTFRGFQVKSGNGGGRGFYIERTSNGQFDDVGVDGYTTGTGILMTRNGNDIQYWRMDRLWLSKCLTGAHMDGADATWNHCLISGNRNGADAILAGSIGLRESIGSNRTFGMMIQGCETLLLSETDSPSFHDGLRLEDFTVAGIRVYPGNAAPYSLGNTNHGWRAEVQSINNNLGRTLHGANPLTDYGIIVEAGCKNVKIECTHYYAAAAQHAGATVAAKDQTYQANDCRIIYQNN